jgi:6-phosphogluconolactonase
MFNRRTFLSLAAGGITAPRLASAQQASRKVALYANVGADLTHYDVDVASAELIKRETVTLPARGAICLAACIETLSICRVQQ